MEDRLRMLVESRIHGDMYVRFGGEYMETYYSNIARRWVLSLRYGQAGFAEPRNPWSPALFPKKRLIAKEKVQAADVFGIYGAKEKRINHVGLVKKVAGDYLLSIEGNSNNRVESRRRHVRTVYAVAKWL